MASLNNNHDSVNPVQRLFKLLENFKSEIKEIYLFALLNSLVSLSLPLGLQAIIQYLITGQPSSSLYLIMVVIVLATILNGWMNIHQLNISEQGGISKSVNWQGGGGFKFYTLAPSLLKQDKFGNWVISQEYNADMLAAAMAKQEGFKYQPNESSYWKQGQSSEQDFIFTTTQFLTVEALDSIKDEMQPGETLMICCKSFQKECKGKFTNITIKKIPQMLLGRCEYGKEDYSLNIINLPVEREDEEADDVIENTSVQAISDSKKKNDQTSLF